MLKELVSKASESFVNPGKVHEEFRKKWYKSVSTTKEALRELHTNNEVDYIGLN